MAYGGLNKYMDAAAELGRNPVSKHQIQPEYGDEQADTGRDCRTRLERLRRERGQGNIQFICSADHRIGNLAPLIHTLLICDDHTYTYILHTYRHRMTRMTGPDCAVMCNVAPVAQLVTS